MKRFFLPTLIVFLFISPTMSQDTRTITIGSKNFPENYILGEIVAQIVEKNGSAQTKKKFGMSGTGLVYQALINGEIDIYPEYTGTISQAILKDSSIQDIETLKKKLEEKSLTVTEPLGFNNTYAFAVRKEYAKKNRLEKISDLAKVKRLRGGFTHEFLKRSDGLEPLKNTYGLSFKSERGMEHSLAYEALANKKVDVIDVYSTDGKLEKFNLTILEDDKKFFPKYFAVFLTRQDFPLNYPTIWDELNALKGKLSDDLMIRLNALAENQGRSFDDVARLFLDSTKWINLKEKKPLPSDETPSAFSLLAQKSAYIRSKLGRLTVEHVLLVFSSLFFAIVVGVPLGLFSSFYRPIGQFVIMLAGIFQTIPSIALLCLLIPYLGIGVFPSLVALFLYALLPIIRNTYSGITSIDTNILQTAKSLGLTKLQTLRKIQMPMASIHILAGIKTSAVINVGTATLAAFIGAGGYGSLIVTGLALNDVGLIMGGAGPAAILALIVYVMFEVLDLVLIPKGLRTS